MNGPNNIISLFFKTARRRGDAVCARFKREGSWQEIRWVEMARAVANVAFALRSRGLRHGDRVAICAPTCLEWTIADCAILAAGGVSVPLYTSLTPDRIARILDDAAPSFLFIDDEHLASRCREAMRIAGKELPLIALRGTSSGTATLSGLMAMDDVAGRKEIDRIVAELAAPDTATIVYTSGTMGEQKGVVLSHGNILAEILAAQRIFDFEEHEVGLHCLPLAHVLGRLLQFYILAQGCESAYAEGIDRLAENYIELSPHFLCGVPRMLEKVHEIVLCRVARSPWLTRALFRWAMQIGHERSRLIQKHRHIPWKLKLTWAMADRLVLRRIRAGLGGRLRCFICGGAALSEEIAKFFHAAGILVIEGWGLTETFAAATANRLDDYHFGTVGKPLPGVGLNLAADGEILVRGPTVFKEYWNMPAETREAFDVDGWFKTGDVGEYSRDGFLRITGRKKELIVTAGGKNIAPQMIESLMMRSPYINQILVCGEGRKFLTALVAPNVGAIVEYLSERGQLVVEGEPLSKNPLVQQLIWESIEEQNRRLAPFETIKRIAILDAEFTVESGELTPTLKIRRAFTTEKYRDAIEALYKKPRCIAGVNEA